MSYLFVASEFANVRRRLKDDGRQAQNGPDLVANSSTKNVNQYTLDAMTSSELKDVLLWCLGINYGVLLIWFGAFVFAHGWMYRLHTRWFKLSVEIFDALHYAGMSVYKIGIILLNLVPLVALYLSR